MCLHSHMEGVVVSLSLSLSAPPGHTSVVTCLATHSDNVLVLSGSEDSTAKLTNTNTRKVSGTEVSDTLRNITRRIHVPSLISGSCHIVPVLKANSNVCSPRLSG